MAMRKTRAVTESKMLSHLRLPISFDQRGKGPESLPLGSLTSNIKELVRQFSNLEVSLAARQLTATQSVE